MFFVKNLKISYQSEKSAGTLFSQADLLQTESKFNLDELTFEIKSGQGFGIVGVNGSGKSSILKAIAGLIPSKCDEMILPKKVITALDLNLFFHPDFSGMDNLFTMNAVYAKSDDELKESIDEIIEFSGLGEFIHRPVREYSTGMKMRLGIAYILYQDFDLLLIDEVLAVGDLSFQRRCLSFLKTKIENGASVLICSHNLEEIAQLCTETILLDKGKTIFQGKTEEVVEYYLKECEKRGQYISAFEIGRIRPMWEGKEQLNIKNIRVLDRNKEEVEHICVGDSIHLEINLNVAFGVVRNPLIRVLIHRNDGLLVFGVNNYRLNQHFDICEGDASFSFNLEHLNLQASLYYISISVWPDEYCSMVTEEAFDEHYMKYKLYVNTKRKDGTGIAYIPCTFNVVK
ncbi:MAG: hypothetical protein COB02_00030 [Candidatus Cloacimonadota bacterium]|nr:MAG: hypothetical protein COB02_04165 [Candidatus Cloacimonadota bacterium]PCJ21010.1 MAG: hypothetical protein COB02_00030 [Candidatus Cloacimonadota bacterium]